MLGSRAVYKVRMIVIAFGRRHGGDRRTMKLAGGRRAGVAAMMALSLFALVGSSPDEQSVDVYSSFPGPFLILSEIVPSADYVISVETVPESLPAQGDWTEFIEIELDMRPVDDTVGSQRMVGEIAQFSPDTLLAQSATVAEAFLPEVPTLLLADDRGRMVCEDGRCERLYVVRLRMSGRGQVRVQWFVRAGIDWLDPTREPAESAAIWFRIQRL